MIEVKNIRVGQRFKPLGSKNPFWNYIVQNVGKMRDPYKRKDMWVVYLYNDRTGKYYQYKYENFVKKFEKAK